MGKESDDDVCTCKTSKRKKQDDPHCLARLQQSLRSSSANFFTVIEQRG